jgi:hypothetical protein
MRQNDGQLPGSKFTIGVLLSALPANEFFATGLLIAPPGIFSQSGCIQIEAIAGRK